MMPFDILERSRNGFALVCKLPLTIGRIGRALALHVIVIANRGAEKL